MIQGWKMIPLSWIKANTQFDIQSLTCMAHISQTLKDLIPLFKQPRWQSFFLNKQHSKTYRCPCLKDINRFVFLSYLLSQGFATPIIADGVICLLPHSADHNSSLAAGQNSKRGGFGMWVWLLHCPSLLFVSFLKDKAVRWGQVRWRLKEEYIAFSLKYRRIWRFLLKILPSCENLFSIYPSIHPFMFCCLSLSELWWWQATGISILQLKFLSEDLNRVWTSDES